MRRDPPEAPPPRERPQTEGGNVLKGSFVHSNLKLQCSRITIQVRNISLGGINLSWNVEICISFGSQFYGNEKLGPPSCLIGM